MINDMINMKNFDYSLLEINKLSFKGVFTVNIYYIKYIPTKIPDHVNIDDVEDFLYFVFNDVDGYIEENNGIRYLVFASTDKNKASKNYKKLWKETKSQIKAINDGNDDDDDDDEPIRYRKYLMKIKFES